jgi:hypothetical protein
MSVVGGQSGKHMRAPGDRQGVEEAQLGVSLFDRESTRKPQLTEAGRQIVAITKLNLLYAAPISIKSSGEIKATEKKDFYLSFNGTVCRWFLNDAEQKVDGDTIQMVREYISSIL